MKTRYYTKANKVDRALCAFNACRYYNSIMVNFIIPKTIQQILRIVAASDKTTNFTIIIFVKTLL